MSICRWGEFTNDVLKIMHPGLLTELIRPANGMHFSHEQSFKFFKHSRFDILAFHPIIRIYMFKNADMHPKAHLISHTTHAPSPGGPLFMISRLPTF